MRVIIAAAGTGGHINPGIAIANKIKKEEPNSEIIFIGTTRGLETDLLPRAGYELKTIESYGMSRSFTIKNIKRLIKTIKSIGQAKKIIKEFKPDIIVGTGGYICISVCIAAKKMKIPYIIHESNVLPGIATKMLARGADKVLVGFKEAKTKLPSSTNVVITGTPTKAIDLKLNSNQIQKIKQDLGFERDVPLVLVFGGSQGAQSINNSLIEIIKHKLNRNYQIMWSVGTTQYNIIKENLAKSDINVDNIKNIKVVPYIYNMGEVMNVASLLVCRSGAMTITEIEKIGKPAIFIPFPYAAENHQEYNARALEKAGAAKVILDKNLNSKILNNMIESLVIDENKLKIMGKNSQQLSIDNVEDRIYKEIVKTKKGTK